MAGVMGVWMGSNSVNLTKNNQLESRNVRLNYTNTKSKNNMQMQLPSSQETDWLWAG
jgi:hypothetical protein